MATTAPVTQYVGLRGLKKPSYKKVRTLLSD